MHKFIQYSVNKPKNASISQKYYNFCYLFTNLFTIVEMFISYINKYVVNNLLETQNLKCSNSVEECKLELKW